MLSDSARPAPSPSIQVRRAWLILAVAFATFSAISLATAFGIRWVYRHATAPESATLTVVSGDGALIRSPGDPDWRLVEGLVRIREGDRISTALGTVVWITMFDGSTVEVAEDTIATVVRMRSSRFLDRTKLIVLDVERGATYVSMASRGEYSYSEFVVRADGRAVVMPDERGREGAGSFLVEVLPNLSHESRAPEVRAAVLRGRAWLIVGGNRIELASNQQTIVAPDGTLGPFTAVVRELVRNGSFEFGLDGWVSFVQRGAAMPEDGPTGASVELVRDRSSHGETTAVEFLRGSTGENVVSAGVRQRIGKTIQLHSSLLLQFEVKITDQHPSVSSNEPTQLPLVIELNYIDIDGQEARWSYGYYIFADADNPIPLDRAVRIGRDSWQRVAFDLRTLSPAPQQVTSIVLYASGESYQTRVAHISLSSGEIVEPVE